MKKACLVLVAWMMLSSSMRADDEGDAPEIRRDGLFPFLKRMVEHPGLRPAFDEKTKGEMMRTFGQLGDAKPRQVTGRVVRAVPPVEFRFSVVRYDEVTFLVVITGANRNGYWHPFGIRVSAVNDMSSLIDDVGQYYRYLPKYEMDRSLIVATGAALEQSMAVHDYAIVDQFIRRLADEAQPLPSFVKFDAASREKINARASAVLKQMEFKPSVSYLGARSFTENFFMAAYASETKLGPGVSLAFFYLHEGKPIIVCGQILAGAKVLAFLPDMQKPEKIADIEKK